MFSSDRHTRFIATVAAFLLILSSSGFTTVLHSCLMAERSCCNASMMAHMNGDEGAVPGKPVLKNNMSCCAVTVAGGLNTNPIVTHDQHHGVQHLDLIVLLSPRTSSDEQQVLTHSTFFSSSTATSPPSVEKYVLNATFLI
jgi:hypothetical protein